MTNILGINLSTLKRPEVEKVIDEFLASAAPHYLVTPNPEIILASHQDEELFYILNKADLSIADGFGLKLASRLYGEKIYRLTGADLTIYLLALAKKRNLKIAVLNWQDGLSSQRDLQTALDKKYPGLQYLILDIDRTANLSTELIKTINDFDPKILFLTFGSPYQEKTIYHNLAKLPEIKLALGIGGAFDFLSGRTRRAPLVWRHLGLEWLWRLIKQPKRWKRIYRATVVFLSKVIRVRFINHFLYRPSVVCFLYKKDNDGYKVLISQREDSDNHWQLPQGGTDGENVNQAGTREIQEELNTDKFKTIANFKNVSRYDFSDGGRQKIPQIKNLVGQHNKKYKNDYKGQKQSLYIAEFLGEDKDIKINFWEHAAWRWVEADKLVESVHPCRQKYTQLFLDKFESLNL